MESKTKMKQTFTIKHIYFNISFNEYNKTDQKTTITITYYQNGIDTKRNIGKETRKIVKVKAIKMGTTFS